MFSTKRLLVIIITALVCSAAGVTTPAYAILNAPPDGGSHPYVALIVNDEGYCSASATSPTVLVTAAHCLLGGTRFTVSFADQPETDESGWPVSESGDVTGTGYAVSDFCGLSGTCGSGLPWFASPDVAVVVLDEPVNLSRYALLPDAGVVDALPDGASLTQVGFGTSAIERGGGQPVFATYPERRASRAALLPTPVLMRDVIVRAQTARTPTGQAQACFGDSGGPLLQGDTIVAVLSFVNGMCSTASFYARVDIPEILAAIKAYL